MLGFSPPRASAGGGKKPDNFLGTSCQNVFSLAVSGFCIIFTQETGKTSTHPDNPYTGENHVMKITPFGTFIGFALLATAASSAPPPPANYPVSTPTTQFQNEEQVFVCPTDSNIVIAVWRDFRLGYRQIGIGRSTDGGNTWTDSLISLDFQVWDWQSDPAMTVDADGNFYVCYLDFDSSSAPTGRRDSSHISVIKSTDKGLTWTGPVNMADTFGLYFEDKQFITADMTGGPYHGNIYLAWHRSDIYGGGSRTIVARSTDGAASFDTLATGTYLGFVQPLVGSDGTVYFFGVGFDPDSLSDAMMMVTSTDGALTFSSCETIALTAGDHGVVDGGVGVFNGPSSAADIGGGPFDGNLYIAFASKDLTNIPNFDYNIEFIRSTDGGQTWSQKIFVNDDTTGQGARYDQFHPWLVCNQEGILAIIFYDQRTDTANHTKFDLFAAYSFDGGQTFSTNHRISDTSVDPSLFVTREGLALGIEHPGNESDNASSPAGGGGLAEYIGCTIFKDHVNAVWTDTRVGLPSVYGANWTLPLLKPRLITPVNGDTAASHASFKWATSWKIDDDQYRVEVADDSSFLSTVLVETTDSASLLLVSNPLTSGSFYYWRVKAFQISTGDSSGYSAASLFYVGICADADGDGFGDPDSIGNDCPDDNCPTVFNPDQADTDGDGIGDACDECTDTDGDGFGNPGFVANTCPDDNCPTVNNPGQQDFDNDGIGDVCDECTDTDGDGFGNPGFPANTCASDNCPDTANPNQEDTNGDDIGDACCCVDRGNANGEGGINVADLTYLVDYLFFDGPTPPCPEEGNVDADGGTNVADLTYLVDHLFFDGPAPPPCP